MKVAIEMEAEDAFELCLFHTEVMKVCVKNIGEDPLLYSKISRIINQFRDNLMDQLPLEEIDRIAEKVNGD